MTDEEQYPPGSWGAEMARLDREVENLRPWWLRAYMRWKLRRARRSMRKGQERAIRKYLRS